MERIAIIPWSPSYAGNRLFDLSSPLNRDHSLHFWFAFRESCREAGWDVVTWEEGCQLSPSDVIIILDPSPKKADLLTCAQLSRSIGIFCESPINQPSTYLDQHLSMLAERLSLVFCYAPSLCERYGFRLTDWYTDLYPTKEEVIPQAMDRSGICMIATNYHQTRHPQSQLDRRLQIVEDIVADDEISSRFRLYGRNWLKAIGRIRRIIPNKVAKRIAVLERIARRIEGYLPANGYLAPVYHGPIASKAEVLRASSFYLIMENITYEGFVTEKLFDALQYGCIPVYFGAPDVTRIVPESLFINGRQFASPLDAVKYALSLSEPEQQTFIDTAVCWLASPSFSGRFGREYRIKELQNAVLEAACR